MTLTLYMTKGLPGSGKTTWATKTLNENNKGWGTRVNKDDLRAMMHLGQHSKANERVVLRARDRIVVDALTEGQHVIVDDTNLHPAHEENLRSIVKMCNELGLRVRFEMVDFTNVPLQECLDRNRSRTDKEPVPEKWIRDQYRRFIEPQIEKPSYDEMLPHCVIVDLDGTLAHMDGRGPYDWDRVGEDKVNPQVLDYIGATIEEGGRRVIILSGRDGSCEPQTREWLNRYLDPSEYELFMREAGDKRKDSIVKRELFEKHIAGTYYPWLVIDDRDQVVRMWRDELGLTVWQVADGNF